MRQIITFIALIHMTLASESTKPEEGKLSSFQEWRLQRVYYGDRALMEEMQRTPGMGRFDWDWVPSQKGLFDLMVQVLDHDPDSQEGLKLRIDIKSELDKGASLNRPCSVIYKCSIPSNKPRYMPMNHAWRRVLENLSKGDMTAEEQKAVDARILSFLTWAVSLPAPQTLDINASFFGENWPNIGCYETRKWLQGL